MRYRARKVFCWTLLAALLCRTSHAAPEQESVHQPRPGSTFLIASDLHFNPMADAALVDKLNDTPPTEWETILNGSSFKAFSQYGQDTNWWLLRSALNAMRTTVPHPALILLTGDLLAHRFPLTYRSTAKNHDPEFYRKFVLKTMEFIGLELRRRFPQTPILLTPGNNDDDCGDYGIEAGGPFLGDTAELARRLARSDDGFKSSWETLGSYDIPHPAIRNARILSLNTVFLSHKYRPQKFSQGCAATSSTAPDDLLSWLETELNRAETEHQKVWLMFHIPPGMDGYSTSLAYFKLLNGSSHPSLPEACAASLVPMWTPKWTARFGELLAKHHSTVTALFAGHTHTDDFRLMNAPTATPSVVLINPAISPVYSQNPAFRVASFNPDGSLGDDSVYYLTNLLFASNTTAGEWKREYSFAQEWRMPAVNATDLSALYGEIVGNQADRAEWLKLYNVSSTAAHVAPDSAAALYCAIEGLSPESYGSCFCNATSHAP